MHLPYSDDNLMASQNFSLKIWKVKMNNLRRLLKFSNRVPAQSLNLCDSVRVSLELERRGLESVA